MTLKKSVLSLALIAALGSANVNAEDSLWSIGVSATAVDIDTVETSSAAVAGVPRTLNIDSDDDAGFGINIGRTLIDQGSGRLRAELAYFNSEQDIENIQFLSNNFSGAAVGGDIEVESILARVVYEFELGRIDPYVGFGIGSTDVEVNAVYGGSAGSSAGAQPPFISDDDSGTALEGRIGANLGLTDKINLFLEYTRTEVDDINLQRLGGGPGGLQATAQEGDVDYDSINFGVTFNF